MTDSSGSDGFSRLHFDFVEVQSLHRFALKTVHDVIMIANARPTTKDDEIMQSNEKSRGARDGLCEDVDDKTDIEARIVSMAKHISAEQNSLRPLNQDQLNVLSILARHN